jgi:hypothetical protein
MIEDLPDGAAPENAIEAVIVELAEQQKHIRHAWLLSLIMNDPEIRESYEAAVARRPAHDTLGRPRQSKLGK